MLLAYIIASVVKLSLFLTTELLFLYVDCRLCLSLGAINIYQDQLYILELRKIYLTTPMAVKNPLQSHREKCKKRLRNGKELEEQFFSFSLTNFYHSIFSPTLKFFLFFFCKVKCTFLNNDALAFCWKHAYMIQTRGLDAVVCWEHMAFSTVWCWWRRSKHQEQDFSFKQSSKEHKGNLLTGGIFQTTTAALPCVQFYPEGFQIANKKIMSLVSRVISFFFIISQSSST